MNIVEYNNTDDRELVFCILDTTAKITDPWIKELTKNQADFTLQNLFAKGYTVLQGTSGDLLLQEATKRFKHACMLSTGTEFTNGTTAIDALLKECQPDYLVKGHILDRGDAYYELHQQCFLVNLTNYKELGCPKIGQQQLGEQHTQLAVQRSTNNFHDSYTPHWIKLDTPSRNTKYNHKCHGWNIISVALKKGFHVKAFPEDIRNNKKHLYPESPTDFYKQLEYVYYKDNFCRTEHIHTDHTEHHNRIYENLRQVVAPASGEMYKSWIHKTKPVTVVLYDYNESSLAYWKENVERLPNVTYKFVKWDLLGEHVNICDYLEKRYIKYTLYNISNIFCYEGTNTLYNIKYKLQKENHLINYLKQEMPDAQINFSSRTSEAFTPYNLYGTAKDMLVYDIEEFKCPTWHISDWCTQ
jgi:hypothetical protein